MFISDDIEKDTLMRYQKACPQARLIEFPFETFPPSVREMGHFRFKALHEALAFRDTKVLLSFDTSVTFKENANFEVCFGNFEVIPKMSSSF